MSPRPLADETRAVRWLGSPVPNCRRRALVGSRNVVQVGRVVHVRVTFGGGPSRVSGPDEPNDPDWRDGGICFERLAHRLRERSVVVVLDSMRVAPGEWTMTPEYTYDANRNLEVRRNRVLPAEEVVQDGSLQPGAPPGGRPGAFQNEGAVGLGALQHE